MIFYMFHAMKIECTEKKVKIFDLQNFVLTTYTI